MSGNRFESAKIKELVGSVGIYSTDKKPSENPKITNMMLVHEHINPTEIQSLYKGISEYQSQKDTLAQNLFPGVKPDKIGPTFFREQFLQYLDVVQSSKKNHGPHFGVSSSNALSAKDATISLEEFLGEIGVELYKAALEEEYNSTEYRNAVFKASFTHLEGQRWAKPPVLVVSGPSASGKTFAAKHALAEAGRMLPRQNNNLGNDVITIDGGICRSESQMRKIVVQLAVSKGYAGIEDLHKHSGILDKMKANLSDAVLQNPNLGIVIPETFSEYVNPFSKIRDSLQTWSNIPGKQLVFSRIDGADPDNFRAVVEQQGNKRAWETHNFQRNRFDLNDGNIPESKAYGKMGFDFGQIGSKLAERNIMKNNPETPFLLIINDMVLKKPDPERPHVWLDAKPGDEGLVIISHKIFVRWELIERISALLEQQHNEKKPEVAQAVAELKVLKDSLQRAPALETKEDKDQVLNKIGHISQNYPKDSGLHRLSQSVLESMKELFSENHIVDLGLVQASIALNMADNRSPQQKLAAYAKLYAADKPSMEQSYKIQAEQRIRQEIAECIDHGKASLSKIREQYQQDYQTNPYDSGLSQLQALETFLEMGREPGEYHNKLIHQVWYLREQIGPKQGHTAILDEAYDTALLTLSSISELAKPMTSPKPTDAKQFKSALQELKEPSKTEAEAQHNVGKRQT